MKKEKKLVSKEKFLKFVVSNYDNYNKNADQLYKNRKQVIMFNRIINSYKYDHHSINYKIRTEFIHVAYDVYVRTKNAEAVLDCSEYFYGIYDNILDEIESAFNKGEIDENSEIFSYLLLKEKKYN